MFRDRFEAGRVLAQHLETYRGDPNTLVLALPRGGVPVGYEVARQLGLPLDTFLVRKLGVPGHEELAMGAIASGGVRLMNNDIVGQLGIPSYAIEAAAEREKQELERRERLYRGARPAPEVLGRTVILVDDGLATGASMRVAIDALRRQNPARIVVAVPVASSQTCHELHSVADEVVCAWMPEPFYAVGQGYMNFDQTTDGEVQELLARAA